MGDEALIRSYIPIQEILARSATRVILQNRVVVGSDGLGFVPLKDGSFLESYRQAGSSLKMTWKLAQTLPSIGLLVGDTLIRKVGEAWTTWVQIGHGSEVGEATASWQPPGRPCRIYTAGGAVYGSEARLVLRDIRMWETMPL